MKKKTITSLLLAFTLILGGCSSGTKSTNPAQNSNQTPGKPQYGGNITISESTDPRVLNPLYVVDQVTFDVQQALYSPFFEIIGGKISYGSGLLENIVPNEDKSAYTLKLKSNLKWHDNTPITADDIVFTINTLLDKKQNVPYQSYGIIDGKPISATKIDNLTAKITLPKPSAAFLGGLSQIYAIPKHIYENESNIGSSEKNNKPIGSGPFKFKEYKPGEYIQLSRFDNYFGGKPYLDTLTFKIIKDANAANAALLNGDINARLIDSKDYNKINSSGNIKINKYMSGRVNAMSFNMNNDVMKDKNVRLAIAYALNKAELVNFAYTSSDFAVPAYSILTPDTLYYSKDLEKIDNNLNKAKNLLATSKKSNIKLEMTYISTDKVMDNEANYIKDALGKIGIEVTLAPVDQTIYNNNKSNAKNIEYDLLLNYYTLGEEPDLYKDIASSNSRSNYSHFNYPKLDALWTQGAIEANDIKRADVYKNIQKTINEDMLIYPISYSNAFYAVDKSYDGFDKTLLKTIYYDYSKLYKVNNK